MGKENEFQNLNENETKQVAGGTDSSKQIYGVDGSWAPPGDCDKYNQVRNEYPVPACCNCQHFKPDVPYDKGSYAVWGYCYRDVE
ncbi:MAG: hypothetical protein MJ189_05395 [Coriobacteriales bacterium]|nr:hypothetical protein [Coriobacteriales bacterium]